MTRLESTREPGTPGLTLGELETVLSKLGPELVGSRSVRVTGVRHDSREVLPGDLFVARRGLTSDGAGHAGQAAERGASAVLGERDAVFPPLTLPVMRVSDVRRGLAFAAESVYGWPSRALELVGITGTNGKTTTATLVFEALSRLGARPALLGTLGFSYAGELETGSHTTPEADDVSRRLARVQHDGGTHVALEVSSHALAQERVAALRFEVAAFTNLSQDHLDFHGTMGEYAAQKARLFTELQPRRSVVHLDDDFGQELSRRIGKGLFTVSRTREADARVLEAVTGAAGITARLAIAGGEFELSSALLGEHNLDNLLVALGILICLGFSPDPALAALSRAPAAPGRLERCDGPLDDLMVVVDYAHTPDALARVLHALRSITSARLWCVFGCGGDRDPGKRPKMGRAVAEAADRAVVTNDNPRSEDPEAIAAAIVPPLEQSGIPFRVELDRALAIERAVLDAGPGDCVLIAGKGHETYQILGARRVPFDDRSEARRALALRRQRGNA
jgi:UDP-N-acetylmuramoyl-L-alanyl-D-glutamate--2,6-diaminopimelate ligase